MAKIKLGLVQDEEALSSEPGEERVGQPAQEKRHASMGGTLQEHISCSDQRNQSNSERHKTRDDTIICSTCCTPSII